MDDEEYVEIPEHIEEPSEEQVVEYMKWLGADLEKDKDLFYIGRKALTARLPAEWKIYQKKDGDEQFYFNTLTGESIWDHPLDSNFKKEFIDAKKKKLEAPESKFTSISSKKVKLSSLPSATSNKASTPQTSNTGATAAGAKPLLFVSRDTESSVPLGPIINNQKKNSSPVSPATQTQTKFTSNNDSHNIDQYDILIDQEKQKFSLQLRDELAKMRNNFEDKKEKLKKEFEEEINEMKSSHQEKVDMLTAKNNEEEEKLSDLTKQLLEKN